MSKIFKYPPFKNLRVFVSISDRKGIVNFLKELSKNFSLEIVATPGTADYLIKNNLKVITTEKITGYPALFSGRIKCIHLPIFAAALADQKNVIHLEQLKKFKVAPFNMVIISLYLLKKAILRNRPFKECIELIDIGGPALIRAAAKNFQSVIPICDPKDYPLIIKDLKNKKNISFEQRKQLAIKVFKLTEEFDRTVIKYLSSIKNV